MLNILRKLGAELFGTNEDLIPFQDPSEGEGYTEGDESDVDDTQDGDSDNDGSESGDESDDEGDGSESGEGSDDGDGSESGEGDDEGDESGDESGESGDDGDGSECDRSLTSENGDEAGDEGGEGGSESESDDNGTGTEAGDAEYSDEEQAGGNDAGGHSDLGDDPEGMDDAFLQNLLDGLENPDSAGLKDNNEAMSEATESCRDDSCEAGEAVWRPYDEKADTVAKPRGDKARADHYRKAARVLTAALKTQFRRKFLQARDPREQHGVKRGRDLSERRLVESFIEIKSNVVPTRPDYRIEERQDVSLAIAVVGDESGSMWGEPAAAAATAMIALAESFDALGAPVMCCGPRNGGNSSNYNQDYYAQEAIGAEMAVNGNYHRFHGSRIDLFKDWDESFRQCKDRFGAYKAAGSTPLSDGIQYALRALNERTERYRVVIVLTDGCPDNPAVVKRQIRLAREAGIFVVGVGIQGAEYYVPQLFPDHHIVVPSLDALPKRMMEVVGNIVFPKRSRKAALDGGRKRQRASR